LYIAYEKYKFDKIIILLFGKRDWMMKRETISISFVIFVLLGSFIFPVSGMTFIKNNNVETDSSNVLTVDFYIQKSDGSGHYDKIDVKTEELLEFKINVKSSRDYLTVAVFIELPLVNDDPMFEYDWGLLGLGSSDPKPIGFPLGEWTANDTDVSWAWFLVSPSWSKDMSFKAKVKKTGSEYVNLKVYGMKDTNGNDDEFFDEIRINSKKNNKPVFLNYFSCRKPFLSLFEHILEIL